MRAVVQRVKNARVKVGSEVVGEIDLGLLILVGACKGDDKVNAARLADRCAGMRIFEDSAGKMNLALKDVGGKALIVSQFTLCADSSRGRRPSFDTALEPKAAESLYKQFCQEFTKYGIEIETGRFGAKMQVELVNDGPVTLVIDC